jgi:hypothetical protein
LFASGPAPPDRSWNSKEHIVMHYRIMATIISAGVIGMATGAGAPTLHAQARFAVQTSSLELPPTALLSALSQYRAVRWANAVQLIVCAPAPLTERPGVQAEYARPHVVPLEESFADAQSVKRSMNRTRAVAMENR